MRNFINKNGSVITLVTGVVSMLGVAGAYVVSLIRDDKREIKRHQKLEEVYQSEIDFYRGTTKKES